MTAILYPVTGADERLAFVVGMDAINIHSGAADHPVDVYEAVVGAECSELVGRHFFAIDEAGRVGLAERDVAGGVLVKESVPEKDAGYLFSISETHHQSKIDAPSGTALTLRDAVLSGLGMEHPAAKDIPIEAHRSGEVAGIHTLTAAGPSDRLVLTHESTSRRPFAEGAVRAAEWLSTRNGVYDFRDVVASL